MRQYDGCQNLQPDTRWNRQRDLSVRNRCLLPPPRRYTRRWMHAVEAVSVSMLMLRKWWMPWIFDQWAHERDTFPQTDLRRSQARLQAKQRAVPQLDVERRESSWQARISDVFVRSQTEIFRLKARIVQCSVMPFPAHRTRTFFHALTLVSF